MATSIQNPSNTNIIVNEWTNVYNAGPVAGFTGTVRIVVEVGSGTIKLANNAPGVTPITQGYGDLYNGTATSIAFEGSLTQVNAALQSLQAFNSNAAGSGTLKISAVKAGSAYNPDNGHYYRYIDYAANGITDTTWTGADGYADHPTTKFNGLQGYLTTITSQQENDFIVGKVGGNAWIGATDNAVEGTWRWVTGPEGLANNMAGTLIMTEPADGNNAVYSMSPYYSWQTGEPNNGGGTEDYAQLISSNTGGLQAGKWNDLNNTGGGGAYTVTGFVIEYGGIGTPTEAAATSSTTLTVQATPAITSNGGGATAIVNYAENGIAAVTTVTASDDDSGDSKTYYIAGGADASSFDINSSTGVLTFKTSPNFEAPTDSDANNSYQVTVRVTDSPVNGQTRYDEQTLTINVTNVNDLPDVTGSLPTSIAATEDLSANVDLSALAFTDQEAAQTFTLKLAASAGTLTAATVAGITVAGSGSAVLTLSGTAAAVTAYLDTAANIQYQGALNANGNGAASIAVSYKDSAMGSFTTYGSAVPVNITAVNDAPVIVSPSLAVTLAAINEDQGNGSATGSNPGASVSSLFGPRFSDVDTGSTMSGIVVVTNTVDAAKGQWQYSTVAGEWHDMGTVSVSDGLVLSAATQVRFAPADNWFGTPSELDVKLLDNTQTTFTSGATKVAAPTTATTESTNTVNLGTTVAPVNDLPTITSDVTAASLTETGALDNSVATASGALTGTLTVADVEGTPSFGIRGGSTSGATITKQGFFGTLALDTATKVWTYTPSNFTAINALGEGKTATDTFDFSVADSNGATASQALTITYTGTNDVPVLAAAIADQVFNGSGAWSYQIPANTFTDAEGTALTYTVQVVDSGGDVVDTITNVTAGDANLPSNWLIFNAASRTLSGTPTSTAPLPLNIKVTASDGSASVADTFTVTLTAPTSGTGTAPANLAPVSTDDRVTIALADTEKVLALTDFGSYQDAEGTPLATVKITELPSVGTLELDGADVTADQVVTAADIAAGKLKFVPVAEATGADYATIGFQVGDGTDFSSSYTLTVDVDTAGTAAAAAPSISIGGTTAYTENAAAQTLLSPPLVLAITDADSTTLASATVGITTGKVAGDVLAFANDGSTMGDIAGVYADDTSVLTLESSGGTATLAQWTAALKAVTFASSSDAPGTTRTLSWKVNDGTNDSNVGTTTTIAVTEVNDAPVATKLDDVTLNSSAALSLNIGPVFTDPEGEAITYSATLADGTTLPSWLSFDAGTQVFSGNPPAGVPYLDIKVIGTDASNAAGFTTFKLNLANADNGAAAANTVGTVLISGAATLGATLTATAPVDADGITGAVGYQWQMSGDSGSTWVDIGGATSSTFTITQAQSNKQVRVQALYNDDGGFAEAPVSTALTVPALNLVGVVTVQGSPTPDEVLVASLSDGNGIVGVTPTYQWYRGDTSGALTTPISGATSSSYTLTNADGGKFVSVQVSYTDNDGTAEVLQDSTDTAVQVGAVAPVAVNDTNTATEAGGAANGAGGTGGSNATGNVLTNDTDENASDTKAVAGVRAGSTEGLGEAGVLGADENYTIAGTYGTLKVKADGSYTYTVNQTAANVQALTGGQVVTDVFNYTVKDSTNKTDIGLLTITLTGADDALLAENLPASFTVTEDVAMAIDFGNSFNLSDPDFPGDATVTLEASEGTLSGTSALDVTVSGSGTGTLTLVGTLGNISTWLKTIGSVQYTSAQDDSGTPGATVAVKLASNTLGTANINITPVNDAPVISSNGGDTPTPISYAENGTTAVTTVSAADPDGGDTQTFSISGGDDADLFRIDASTGALTFKNSPNFEIPADANNDNSYIVTVKVTDAAGLMDEQMLTINVTNDISANDPRETGGTGSHTIADPVDNAKINVTGSGTTTITNPAGNLTIANSGSGTVVVQGLNDGATVNTSGTGATQISDPEGSLTVANSGTGTVTVDGLSTGSVLTTTGSGPTAVTNPDGSLTVANSGTGTVTVSGLKADASLTASGTGPTQVNDPEGNLTVNNSGSGVVTVDGLNTGSVLTTTGNGSTAVTNPDGNLEVANSGTGTVTVSGLNPGASLTASGTGPTQVNDPEGHLTVNNSGSGTVTVNGLNTDSVLTTTGNGPTTVANPDGNLSVANNGTGTVTVNGLNPNASLSASGSGPTLIENPDASLIVANSGTGTVTVNGLNTGGVLTTTGSGPTAVTNPDGNLAVANNGTGIVTVNGLNPNASLTASGTGPTLVNDPEGNLTVSNSGSGTVTVAGLNDDAVLNSNGTGPVRVTDPDDDVSVVNNGSGTVSVDGMNAGAVLSSSGTGPVTITNPDGNLRVANTGTGTVTVEDLKPSATLTTTGTQPILVDLSHLSSGQTITIDNDGSGVVNLVNVPQGVTVLSTGSGTGGINYAPTITDIPGAAQAVTAGTAAALADFKVADKDASQTLTVTLKATNGTVGGLTDADTNTDGIQLTGTADDINTALADATFTAAGAGAASITISVTDGVVSSPTTATYSLNAVPAPSSGSAPTPAPSPEGAIQNGVSNTTVTTDGGAQTTTTGTIGTVPVVETVTVTADGNTVRELVYVPTTTGTGAGSSTPTVLPLLYESVAGSTSNTTVSLPSGVGLVSVGDRTPTTTTGQQGLITLIQSTVSDGDPSRTDMLGGGQSFLNTLPQDATLWVNKIQLTAPTALPNAPSVPVVVSGAARTEASTSTADKLEALVIDATALPQGTVIELHDIDFAVVVGNGVFVRGGSGANVVYGGAGSQYILLGEADDVLYGGADDDTVGSEGGNDRIFGNAGNDTLFGGEGEDLLHGGADTDVATFTGSISRYEIVRDHGKTIVRALDRADDVDTVINVETLRFDDADYTVENAPQYTVIASLYGEVLDRQADLAGFQYWAERYAAGESMGDIALSFLYSAEYQSGSGLQFSALSTAAQLDLFYLHFLGRTPDEAGHAYWMNRIEDGMSLNDLAHSFVVSTEMQGVYAQPTAWEFLL